MLDIGGADVLPSTFESGIQFLCYLEGTRSFVEAFLKACRLDITNGRYFE